MWKNGRLVGFEYDTTPYHIQVEPIITYYSKPECKITYNRTFKRLKFNSYCGQCHSFSKCRSDGNCKLCLNCYLEYRELGDKVTL
jgi:hypothetical protein